jgi:hypothetical protein
MWAVFRAPLPNRIYCPHCGERLRYGDTTLVIAAAVAFIAALVVGGFLAADASGLKGPAAVALWVGLLIAGGALLEVAFVFTLWYGDFRLKPVNRPQGEWDDEGF